VIRTELVVVYIDDWVLGSCLMLLRFEAREALREGRGKQDFGEIDTVHLRVYLLIPDTKMGLKSSSQS
jgi:hypothetical protein